MKTIGVKKLLKELINDLEDLKAVNIVTIDIKKRSSIADYLIIVSVVIIRYTEINNFGIKKMGQTSQLPRNKVNVYPFHIPKVPNQHLHNEKIYVYLMRVKRNMEIIIKYFNRQ